MSERGWLSDVNYADIVIIMHHIMMVMLFWNMYIFYDNYVEHYRTKYKNWMKIQKGIEKNKFSLPNFFD